jgi:hypothetical protein
MNKTSNFSVWTYVLFPGIAMLLGWGLRGHIGGGPFGAMIPGAMVALAISMLLGFRAGFTSLIVVFGIVGVGLGGEMTYGQTLGFLRNPETVWWGNLATTIKGAVWGIGAGAILGLGLIHKRIPRKTILIAFVVLLIGILIGFKLINDTKFIYFSDPVNKPRDESWGGLLFGAIAVLIYLKIKIQDADFKIVWRFAKWGLISGGLGFGIGGLWMVLGSNLPDVLFRSWWKMMEFTFGLFLGAGLGYAAWLSRDDFDHEKEAEEHHPKVEMWKELALILVIAMGVYWLFPMLMEPLADNLSYEDGFLAGAGGDFFRMLVNYAFYGFVMVLIALYRKELVWQIGITLTFCHAAIDMMRDIRPEPDVTVNLWIQLVAVIFLTLMVAWLVAKYRNEQNINNAMFQILVWSTIFISIENLCLDLWFEGGIQDTGILNIYFRRFFVDTIFLIAAIYVSRKSFLITKLQSLN